MLDHLTTQLARMSVVDNPHPRSAATRDDKTIGSSRTETSRSRRSKNTILKSFLKRREIRTSRRHEKLKISNITTRDQSFVSSISRSSTLHSSESSITMVSFLVDSHNNRENGQNNGSAFTTVKAKNKSSSETPLDMIFLHLSDIINDVVKSYCTNENNPRSPEEEVVLIKKGTRLADPLFDEPTDNVETSTSPADPLFDEPTQIEQKSTSLAGPLFDESTNKIGESAGPLKRTDTQKDNSKDAHFICFEDCFPDVHDLAHDDGLAPPSSNPEPVAYKVYFDDAEEHIATIPKCLTSSASKYLSSSISVDERSESIYFVAADEEEHNLCKWTGLAQTSVAPAITPVAPVMPPKVKVFSGRSLFDTLSFDTSIGHQSERNNAKSSGDVEQDATEVFEVALPSLVPRSSQILESEVLEVTLPSLEPRASQSLEIEVLEVTLPSVEPRASQSLETEGKTIEVSDTGQIFFDEVQSSDFSISNDSPRECSADLDVHVSYKIEDELTDFHDDTSLSQSQESNDSATFLLTPKHNSMLKSFLFAKWGKKKRRFSLGKTRYKTTTADDEKARKSLCDSPDTATTELLSVTTGETIPSHKSSFVEKSMSRNLPYLIRSRTYTEINM